MDALRVCGTSRRVSRQLVAVTWLCCSGCAPIAAIGTMSRAQGLLVAVTWLFCSGRVPMAAPADASMPYRWRWDNIAVVARVAKIVAD
jgi:hypothetical protein